MFPGQGSTLAAAAAAPGHGQVALGAKPVARVQVLGDPPMRHPRAPWGPKKGIKKEAFLSTNEEFGRLPSFPENIFYWGHFLEN